VDFESQEFYRDNFSVMHYWAAAAVVGAFSVHRIFSGGVLVWIRCRDLWKANERTVDVKHVGVEADTRWLQ